MINVKKNEKGQRLTNICKKPGLLIFVRNQVYGKVKTRLATTIGNDKVLQVYHLLISHTFAVTRLLLMSKFVYYSEYVVKKDIWGDDYLKAVQQGIDLGERMSNAIREVLEQGYKKAVIIGTDCYQLTGSVIRKAFNQLERHDIVVGPALDDGYYLLGMKAHHRELFENMIWSTEKVFDETIERCDKLGLSFFLLPVLNDVDDENDLEGTDILDSLCSV